MTHRPLTWPGATLRPPRSYSGATPDDDRIFPAARDRFFRATGRRRAGHGLRRAHQRRAAVHRLAPAQASALVHTAEIFTTGASAASHIYHRNVDWRFVSRLGVAGVLGAILGAWILSNIDVTAARRYVYVYLLLMGAYILWRSAADRADP